MTTPASFYPLDTTHDPALQSWVASANAPDTDFPLQNLPFGRFRLPGQEGPWQIGVAIGDQVLALAPCGLLPPDTPMRQLLAWPLAQRRALRQALSQGLQAGSAQAATWAAALHPMAQVQLGLPCDVGDYTDFYSGIHHALHVGRLMRPDQPLLPNYPWVPIGYHGRASTLCASGHAFHRPWGQTLPRGASVPVFGPSQRLDYELELGLVVGQANAPGRPMPLAQAEAHLFGLTLLNDWSARDVQGWEYQPLGPFLAKNFATTLSPWIVTLEALAPFRLPFVRPTLPGVAPEPLLPYLDAPSHHAHGGIDIQLEVWLQTAAQRAGGRPENAGPVPHVLAPGGRTEGDCICRTPYAQAAWWSAAQLLAHHTVGGCAMQPGDILGTGTLSGPVPGQCGSLLEHSEGGRQALTLSNGEQRRFLEDGDRITLRAHCQRDGARRIGWGPCEGTVLPALPQAEVLGS